MRNRHDFVSWFHQVSCLKLCWIQETKEMLSTFQPLIKKWIVFLFFSLFYCTVTSKSLYFSEDGQGLPNTSWELIAESRNKSTGKQRGNHLAIKQHNACAQAHTLWWITRNKMSNRRGKKHMAGTATLIYSKEKDSLASLERKIVRNSGFYKSKPIKHLFHDKLMQLLLLVWIQTKL